MHRYTPFLAEIAAEPYNPDHKEVFADKLEDDGQKVAQDIRDLAAREKYYMKGAVYHHKLTHKSNTTGLLSLYNQKVVQNGYFDFLDHLLPVRLRNWSSPESRDINAYNEIQTIIPTVNRVHIGSTARDEEFKYLSQLNCVEQLLVSDYFNSKQDILQYLAALGAFSRTELKKIVLDCYYGRSLNVQAVVRQLSTGGNAKSIYLRGMGLISSNWNTPTPQLEALETSETEEDIATICAQAPNLRALCFNFQRITNEDLVRISTLPKLQILKIPYSEVTDFTPLITCKNLEFLDVANIEWSQQNLEQILAIAKLRIINCGRSPENYPSDATERTIVKETLSNSLKLQPNGHDFDIDAMLYYCEPLQS